jgi:uncharacterized protein (DUF2141 family)
MSDRIFSYRKLKRTLLPGTLVWCLFSAGNVPALSAAEPEPQPKTATLRVSFLGLKHRKGKLIAKLFRRRDNAPKGDGFRKVILPLSTTVSEFTFEGVPYGEYALFLFHDENSNGTLDHNFLRIPTEPMGFSAGFRPSIFSGVPGFDDLKFQFSSAQTAQRVSLE